MSKYITILVALICFFLFTSINALAQDILCNEFNDSCELQQTWQERTEIIYLEQFPNCKISVHFFKRQCNLSGEPHKTQWTVDYVVLSGDCNDLISWITNNYTGISMEKWISFKSDIIEKVTLKLFMLWYNSAPDGIKALVQCPLGHYKQTFYQKTCTKLCYSTLIRDGELYFDLREVNCHDHQYSDCCGLTLKICMQNGVPVVEKIPSGHVMNCYVAPWPDPSGCPENTVDQEIIWCRDNCLTGDE